MALGVVSVTALAACGGSDKPATPATSSPLTTTKPVDTRFSGEGSGDFCDLAKSFNTGFSGITPGASIAQLKVNLQEADTAIHRAVDVAPTEIKGDVGVIADSFTKVVGVIANANYDLTNISPDALATFQSAEFSNSAARLQAYMTSVCGIRK